MDTVIPAWVPQILFSRAKVVQPGVSKYLVRVTLAGIVGEAICSLSTRFRKKNPDAVIVKPTHLIGGSHTLHQESCKIAHVFSQFLIPAPQVDVDQGELMGIPVAPGTLMKDQGAELVGRKEQVVCTSVAFAEHLFEKVKCHRPI
ncbi:MAG: hypothetical protein P1S46_07660 [bacterium]|nr:hypothetical protein [bacterium]